MHGSPLVGHIVGSIATPSGNGYGIFDFSKQPFFGSLAGTHLSTPIVGMTATG